MKILVHMTDAQKIYFKQKILNPFEKENKVKVDVISTSDIDSIEILLKRHKKKISLVKIPFVKSWSLVINGGIMSLNNFLQKEAIDQFNNTYILTWFGRKKDQQFFLPRKFETRIMVYRKSKVRDALNAWATYRDTINTVFKKINGFGLPGNYTLENKPLLWDYFDIFVLGFIWSQLSYNNKTMPRIAHRGKRYFGTSLRIIDRVYQCKGDSSSMLRMDGDAVVDAFEWEAIYAYANIYNKRMWKEGWSGQDIWEGFASNDVFLSFMTQIDCFYLYGTGLDGIIGYVDDTSDIGMTLMPTGCSAQVDKNGDILRKGSKAITTGGWWWALPAECPDPLLAYSLFTHITSRTNQLQECTRFGMIPVRQDILKDKFIIIESGWISRIFRISYRQIQKNDNNILPSHPRFDKIANVYLDAWYDIVVSKNWASEDKAPDRGHIATIIAENYSRKVNKYLNFAPIFKTEN